MEASDREIRWAAANRGWRIGDRRGGQGFIGVVNNGLSLKILTWIAAWPERRAQDLSDEIKIDKPRLKAHVRRLKELGLTESMHTGYRLSARGRRLMAYVGKQ